jgi:hypothetical protein
MADKIERKWIGTRVGFILAAIGCYFGTLLVITNYGTVILDTATLEMLVTTGLTLDQTDLAIVVLDQDKVWTALEWLIGAIGLAVVGDTARPSGMKAGAFGVTTNGK